MEKRCGYNDLLDGLTLTVYNVNCQDYFETDFRILQGTFKLILILLKDNVNTNLNYLNTPFRILKNIPNSLKPDWIDLYQALEFHIKLNQNKFIKLKIQGILPSSPSIQLKKIQIEAELALFPFNSPTQPGK